MTETIVDGRELSSRSAVQDAQGRLLDKIKNGTESDRDSGSTSP